MTICEMRYSPHAAPNYAIGQSLLLKTDPEAWNLAWLSYDVRNGPHPDPHFTTLVRRTLQVVLATGSIDLISRYPDNDTVRGLLKLPPPQAVARLQTCSHFLDLPLFAAYGAQWVTTINERSRLYREPEHPSLDRPVTDFTEAIAALAHSRRP